MLPAYDKLINTVVYLVGGRTKKQCCTASLKYEKDTNAAQLGSTTRSLRMESRYEFTRGQRGLQAEPLKER